MIREYLQLTRLPNIFTAPTNIMAGYLASTPVSEINLASLGILMTSSALLYASGIIFNDYFDADVDKKERPSRPIPSGRVSKKVALRLGIALMASAAVISITVSWQSFGVVVLLSSAIFFYDYKLKHHKFFGPATMGGTRFLNVVLGASPGLYLSGQSNLFQPFFVAFSMFAYVIIISLFSRKEMSGASSRRTSVLFALVYAIAAAIAIATLSGFFKISGLSILVPFIAIQGVILWQSISGSAAAIRGGVKWMVISIIILDSVFVSGTAGLYYGMLTLLFLAPAVVLSRRFYVT